MRAGGKFTDERDATKKIQCLLSGIHFLISQWPAAQCYPDREVRFTKRGKKLYERDCYIYIIHVGPQAYLDTMALRKFKLPHDISGRTRNSRLLDVSIYVFYYLESYIQALLIVVILIYIRLREKRRKREYSIAILIYIPSI